MDGSQPEQFYVFNDRMLIHCLTYSQENHQLFWINALKNAIQLWDFKSNMIKMVYETSNPIITSLTSSGRTLYFSDNAGWYIFLQMFSFIWVNIINCEINVISIGSQRLNTNY